MMHNTGWYPRLRVDTAGSAAVGQAGGVLLVETIRTAGFDRAMSTALRPWRKPLAVRDPGKIVLDLAIALALGGDCLADVGVRRAEPGVYGHVASDPTVSRLVDTLAAEADHALAAIEAARAIARARVWALAGEQAPDHDIDAAAPLLIDLDATLVTSHSEKQSAAPTFKRGFGFHPLCAFVDHGSVGSGEPLHLMLRPGNAGSNTAADHIAVTRKALQQLPGYQRRTRPGRKVLIRADSAGGTHAFLDWLTSRRLSYSVGFTLGDISDTLEKIPAQIWTPAYDADGAVRDGAWVAELTDLLDLSHWPVGMRVIARKETSSRRPTPPDRRRRSPNHRVRHQHQDRSAPRPGVEAPAPGPRRRPNPEPERHRADEPATPRLRPEPHLVRHRRARRRTDRLDATPRPPRPRSPTVGTETSPLPDLQHRRATGPDRPPGPSPPRYPITLDPADRRQHPPAPSARRPRLTTRHPSDFQSEQPRPWNPAPTEATPSKPSHPDATIDHAQPASRRNHDQQVSHERLRLTAGVADDASRLIPVESLGQPLQLEGADPGSVRRLSNGSSRGGTIRLRARMIDRFPAQVVRTSSAVAPPCSCACIGTDTVAWISAASPSCVMGRRPAASSTSRSEQFRRRSERPPHH